MVGRVTDGEDRKIERSDEDRRENGPSTEPAEGAGDTPRIDTQRMFMEDLTQEELSSLSSDELSQIHEKARKETENNNPDAVLGSCLPNLQSAEITLGGALMAVLAVELVDLR